MSYGKDIPAITILSGAILSLIIPSGLPCQGVSKASLKSKEASEPSSTAISFREKERRLSGQ